MKIDFGKISGGYRGTICSTHNKRFVNDDSFSEHIGINITLSFNFLTRHRGVTAAGLLNAVNIMARMLPACMKYNNNIYINTYYITLVA